MKKIITLLVFCLYIETVFGQILVRNENWPNPAWTVGGTYTPASLVLDPSTSAYFKYDSALVSPSGASSLLYIMSPVFSLKPAYDGNERLLKINFDIAFTTLVTNTLYVQYWDAKISNWVVFPEGVAPVQSIGNYQNCTYDPSYSSVSLYFDFSGFDTNQLQNFRYRFVVEGTSSQIAGVCLSNVIISSFACGNPPSNLEVFEVTFNQVTINWTYSGSGIQNWTYEYGLHGFTLGTGINISIDSTYNPPLTLFGLYPNTSYDFYIKQSCTDDLGPYFTGWAGPLTFTTSELAVNTFSLENVKLLPNPTNGLLEITAVDNIKEIKIYSVNGQELFGKTSDDLRLNIDFSPFNTGLYLVKIYTDKGTGVYKVVKN